MIERPYKTAGFRVEQKPRRAVRARAHHVIDHVEQDLGWHKKPFPISTLLELWASKSGSRVDTEPPNLDILLPEEIPWAAAEFVPHENVIRVNEKVWNLASDGDPESLWVLAHETGHVVLKHYAAAGLYYGQHQAVNPNTDSEHQANWFADELMMDSRNIDPFADGVLAIMNKFGVSETMAARRIRELILERK